MKATLFALFVGLLMVGWGESSQPSEIAEMNDTAPKKDAIETPVDYVDLYKLKYRNGVYYLPNEETLFTGRAEVFSKGRAMEGPVGQKRAEVNFKNGKYHGLFTEWYRNGQKRAESNWKDGKLISAVRWKPNGEKCPVTKIDKDGNGVVVWYKNDGTERVRFTYKDGKIWSAPFTIPRLSQPR